LHHIIKFEFESDGVETKRIRHFIIWMKEEIAGRISGRTLLSDA